MKMNQRKTRVTLGFIAVVAISITLVSGGVARAGILTLQEGVAGYTHLGASLRSGDGYSGAAICNYGGSTQWLLGQHATASIAKLRVVLGFDLDRVPAGSVITSVSLSIMTDSAAGTGTIGDVQLHEVTGSVEMDEGTLNGAGSATEGVMWSRIRPLVPWVTRGGDYSSTVLSTVASFNATVTGAQRTFVSTASFVAAAQAALNSGSSFEMILLSPTAESTPGVTNFARIVADDGSNMAGRPVLTIEYESIPEPATLCLLGIGSTLAVVRRRRAC